MKLVIDNQKIVVKNCAKPKFGGRGRTWDTWTVIKVNGVETDVRCDSTWGFYAYIKVDEKWYKFNVEHLTSLQYKQEYTLKRGW
jgi:hypothetical protein